VTRTAPAPSPYRWVVLAVFAILNAVIQIQWLTFAPIAREARIVYHASALQIDLLSMIFMGVFVLACVPASYVIDTRGIRAGVGTGAVLTGAFGLLKGFCATRYAAVVVAQVGLAVAQPFIINAATKVAGVWFPVRERATAVGVATLAQFLGIIVAMVATPLLVARDAAGGVEIGGMLMAYGWMSLAGAVLALTLLRPRPRTAGAGDPAQERVRFLQGIRRILGQRDMRIMLAVFFVGLGIFNAVSTCIDQICQGKGLTTEQTGLVGGLMLVAGIAGALVLPVLSDRLRKRKALILTGIVGALPGLAGLACFSSPSLLLASSSVLGFFLLGAGAPVGFQYCAEVTSPAPESMSQGLLLLAGQISGMLFILGMNRLGMVPSLCVFVALWAACILLMSTARESPLMRRPRAG